MSTFTLRQRFIAIASLDLGQVETSRNHGPAIAKFWGATTYRDGYADRAPYCAAAMCYWLREWLKDPEVLESLNMTPARADRWRCKSAAAFGWTTWAKERGLLVMSDSNSNKLHTADVMVFDMSHIGIVSGDYADRVRTVEANTGSSGGRDGDGIFAKDRPREIARNFIRLLP
jgi:hypothetical protein